jgi:hypothetical protein
MSTFWLWPERENALGRMHTLCPEPNGDQIFAIHVINDTNIVMLAQKRLRLIDEEGKTNQANYHCFTSLSR